MAYSFKYTRKAVVQAVLEATAGVDPNANYLAMLVNTGATVTKESTNIERTVLNAEFGTFGSGVTGSMWKGSFEQELKALGRDQSDDIIVPEWQVPLQACAVIKNEGWVLNLTGVTGTFTVGETVQITAADIGVVIDATASVIYVRKVGSPTEPAAANTVTGTDSAATATVDSVTTALVFEPTSDDTLMKTMSLRFNQGKILKQVTYGMGSATLTGTAKDLPKIAFDLTGIYNAPTDANFANTTTSTVKPLPFQGVSLTWGNLDTTKVALREFSLNLNNTVGPVDDAQKANSIGAIQITDSMPTLSLSFSQPLLSEYDPYTEHENQTERNFAVSYGTNGKFIRVGARKCQLQAVPGENDQNGINHYTLDCSLNIGGDTPKWYLMVY